MPDSDRLKHAETLHQQGQFDEALKLYQAALKDDPQQPEVHHLIAYLYLQIKQYKKAQSAVEKAIKLQPQNPVFINTLGNIFAAQDQQEKSIEMFKKAIKLNPKNAIGHNNLANRYYYQHKYQSAEKSYKKAIEIDPRYLDAHYNLALTLLKQEKHEQAIKQFREVLKLKPEHYSSLYLLGQLLIQQQAFRQAIECFNQCLQQRPNDSELNHKLGLALFKDKQYEGAIHHLKQALIYHSKHPEAHHNLANALLLHGDSETALNYFFKQLEINPFFESYYNIGVLLSYKERHRDASQYLLQALKLKPDDLNTHLNLGSLYLKLMQYDEATQHYQEAQRLKPNDAEIQHILSAISQTDNPKQAPSEYTSHLFNQYAPFYDKHLSQFLKYDVPQQLQQAVFEEAGELQHAVVIDLGCGTGLCGAYFTKQADTLIGIDIAADMIEVAKTKHIYDQLEVGDISETLAQFTDAELILAADVFTYIGDLSTIFKRVYHSLKPDGIFAFSVEKGSQHDYQLQPTIRYAHSRHYLEQLSDQNQFKLLRCDNIILRKQNGKPVEGYLVILQK